MYRNFNLFPFQPPEGINWITFPLFDLLGLVLRSTHSMLNTIALKPFLTSAIKFLTWLLATATKICTDASSRKEQSLSPSYHNKWLCITPTYIKKHTWIFSFLKQFICLYTFSAINFQGYCICPVSCYTLLSRFQLPWPLSGCHNTTTLFVVSNNECNQNLAHLKLRSVHPASPILLTKIGPQRKNNIDMHKIKWSLCTSHTHLKFDNKLRKFLPQVF